MIKITILAAACSALLIANDAQAFRCGNRLIKEGMFESEVIALCGEPVSTRHMGYVLRPVHHQTTGRDLQFERVAAYLCRISRRTAGKEMLFNFGPRKLMRLIRFEGGRMVSVETAGYGHRSEKNNRRVSGHNNPLRRRCIMRLVVSPIH